MGKMLCCQVKSELYQKVRALCEKNNQSLNQFLRALVVRELARIDGVEKETKELPGIVKGEKQKKQDGGILDLIFKS